MYSLLIWFEYVLPYLNMHVYIFLGMCELDWILMCLIPIYVL